MINTDTQEAVSVKCEHQECESSCATNIIDKILYIKERYNVSDQTYHEMSMVADLPSSYSHSKAAKKLNDQCITQCTPGEAEGVQQSITDRLRLRICHMLQLYPSYPNRHLKVKITGDGTAIS